MTREDIFLAIGETKETFLTACGIDAEPVLTSNLTGRKVFRAVLVAAIVIFLFATTAFAYTGFVIYDGPRAMLEAFFGQIPTPHGENCLCTACVPPSTPIFERVPLNEEAAQIYIQPNLVTVDKSVVNERSGHRLTVDGYIYDAVNACGILYYTLERYGEIQTPYSYTLQYDGEITGIPSHMNHPSKRYLIADQSTETCLKIAAYYVVPHGTSPTLQIGFKGMLFKNSDVVSEAYVTIPYEGKGLPHLSLANGSIRLSPIGIYIDDKLPAVNCTQENGKYIHIDVSQLAVCYDDGTQYLVNNNDIGNLTENFGYALMELENDPGLTYVFNRIVDIGKVCAVIVNGIRYPVVQ